MARHGQTEDNVAGRLTGWGDVPLSAIGRSQAARLAEYVVSNYSLHSIYTSPLIRTMETATIVARRAGLTPVVVDGLKEIFFGDCEGLTELEFRQRHPAVVTAAGRSEDMDFTWPGGECRRTFYERVRAALDDITRLNSGRTVLVVGHGGALAYYLADLADGKPGRWRQFLPENCAVAEIAFDESGTSVVRHNYVAHLRPGG